MRSFLLQCAICVVVGTLYCSSSAAQDDEGSSPKPTVDVVVVEGRGISADEALKDALRNAVRQVVGAIVETETLIKDDELIADKVLTYSNGIVQTWQEIPGSKKNKGGLYQVVIKATVERQKLVARLKAANVTMKRVDGNELFGKAITEMDAERDAAAILEKAFEGFPANCWRAEVEGQPKIIEKDSQKVRIGITYRVNPDRKAYSQLMARLRPVLSKIAKDSGTFSLKFERDSGWPRSYGREKSFDDLFVPSMPPTNPSRTEDDFLFGQMPKAFGKAPKVSRRARPEDSVLVLNTSLSATAEHSAWTYYLVDQSLERSLSTLATRRVGARIVLLDSNNKTLAVDQDEIAPVEHENYRSGLVLALGTTKVSNGVTSAGRSTFFVAPVLFVFHKFDNRIPLSFSPVRRLYHTFSLSLEELKALDRIKCEMVPQ
jgi:hypothetical protein